ncbi:MAG: FAD-dependent oxidoreductase [Dehalococcoidales bacterium]|nr:FAD-dependent oxidoreductase [Dehalococcoidales bacterium]
MIIGAGPAGLSAAVYAARKQLKTLLLSSDIGGQMNWTMGIENYLGYQFITASELISKFHQQISQFPIDQKTGEKVTLVSRTEDGFEATTDTGEKYQAKAVVFATGKQSRRLDVPGETTFTGKGVTYCSVCDGPLFAGMPVAIVGGGNSAVQAALDMVKIAKNVTIISLTKLTADPILANKLLQEKNLDIYIEYKVTKIEGQQLVKQVTMEDVKSKKVRILDVSGVFIEIGLIPNSDAVKELVKLNSAGEVPVNCSGETGVPGFFAAGDVTDVPEKQIVIAAGEGAKAALRAHRFLQMNT